MSASLEVERSEGEKYTFYYCKKCYEDIYEKEEEEEEDFNSPLVSKPWWKFW